jgi:hypothetical protein
MSPYLFEIIVKLDIEGFLDKNIKTLVVNSYRPNPECSIEEYVTTRSYRIPSKYFLAKPTGVIVSI